MRRNGSSTASSTTERRWATASSSAASTGPTTTRSSFFLYESAEFQSDAFEVGLRLGYAFSEAKYEVALFGRNILDEEIVRGGIDFNNLTGFTNDPATWGLEFAANF